MERVKALRRPHHCRMADWNRCLCGVTTHTHTQEKTKPCKHSTQMTIDILKYCIQEEIISEKWQFQMRCCHKQKYLQTCIKTVYILHLKSLSADRKKPHMNHNGAISKIFTFAQQEITIMCLQGGSSSELMTQEIPPCKIKKHYLTLAVFIFHTPHIEHRITECHECELHIRMF